MKLGIIGCLVGSAAAMLFSGCATDETSAQRSAYSSDVPTDAYRSAYASTTTPVFVEQRTVPIGSTTRVVSVYRTGDEYFYTLGGRRVVLTDYPTTVVRTGRTRVVSGPAYSSTRYRDPNQIVVRTGYDEDDRTVRRTITTGETPAVIGERVLMEK